MTPTQLFYNKLKIDCTATPRQFVSERASKDPEWPHDHYASTYKFTRQGKQFSVKWHEGTGITERSTPEEVLHICCRDAADIAQCRTFNAYCEMYGFDTDSRRAYGDYKIIRRDAKRLRNFLPDDAIEQFANMED